MLEMVLACESSSQKCARGKSVVWQFEEATRVSCLRKTSLSLRQISMRLERRRICVRRGNLVPQKRSPMAKNLGGVAQLEIEGGEGAEGPVQRILCHLPKTTRFVRRPHRLLDEVGGPGRPMNPHLTPRALVS